MVGGLALAVLLLVLFWNWDWFIPLVNARASAALGRQVTITHLHVRLGRVTTVRAEGVMVANPSGFPAAAPMLHMDGLSVAADVGAYLRQGAIVLPRIVVTRPVVNLVGLPDGRNNYTLKLAGGGKPAARPPHLGELVIENGGGHVTIARLRADFAMRLATRATPTPAIVLGADGVFDGQKITASLVAGALLALRDAAHPYPIDLRVVNGGTRLQLVGSVRNPLNFAGAALQLRLEGPDLSRLYALTGVPLPPTPPFLIAGAVDYAPPQVRFRNFSGRVGSSDLEGDVVAALRTGQRPDVTMDLRSKRVDLADLGGLIGTPPGRMATPGQTPAQKAALAQAAARPTLLPSTPINLPKLRTADLHVRYRAAHIENKFVPVDDIAMTIDVVDGRIVLHPVAAGVGRGDILLNADLTPDAHDVLHAVTDVRFRSLDLARIMAATHAFHGQGTIGGQAKLDARGNSLAALLGHGDGELKLILLGGGNVSALLVDISGLEFGNAVLSALGVPNRAQIQCFVADLPLRRGILDTNVFLLDTTEGRVTGQGSVDFTDQTVKFALTTRSKHFSVGSLPGPIDISGPLGKPSIALGTETVARAGAAAALGVLLTPLGALLPTIQFGVGDDNACTRATAAERAPLRVHRR